MKNLNSNKIRSTILLVIVISSVCISQTKISTTKTVNSKQVFVSLGVDKSIAALIKDNGYNNVINIDIPTTTDKLIFNEELLSNRITALIPFKESTETVVLDWEGEPLNILLQKDSSNSEYKKVFDQFVSAYNFVKSKRPNVTCGFYGLPFRTYWNRDNNWVKKCISLSPLLSHFDAIFPSLYIPYKDDVDVRELDNINFIKDNINISLRLSYELKKTVFFYIWHRYHDSNKKFPLELIPEKYFRDQIKAIAQSTYKTKKPDGIIWWSAEAYFEIIKLKNKKEADLTSYKFSDKETTLKYLQIINEAL